MLVGNQKNQKYLDTLINNNSISHAYIFAGPRGVGKTAVALDFAKKIVCDDKSSQDCSCNQCRLSIKGNHPDILINDEVDALTVEKSREMIGFLDLKPYQAKNKVLLISHGERMTTAAANSLLKTLEEPALNTTIIITTENIDNLLPTIVSRSQVVKYTPIEESEIEKILSEKTRDTNKIKEIIRMSGGQVGLALGLAEDAELFEDLRKAVDQFEQKIYSKSVFEKIFFAEKLSKEKDKLFIYLDCFESVFRQKLINESESPLMIYRILDKLSDVRESIGKNVNLQLVLESLMLIGEDNA